MLCLLIPVFSLNSCSANNKIVFANYESYFSTDLIKKYQDDVNFLYFQSDSDIRAKFRQSYDIAVPSNAEALRYLKEGWLSQIDWKAFGQMQQEAYGDDSPNELQYLDENKILQPIECGHDAEFLLSGNPNSDMVYTNEDDKINIDVMCDTYDIVQELNEYCFQNDIFPQSYLDQHLTNYSILDFIIPYFGQNYVFSYKGEKIENDQDEDLDWSYIQSISGKGENHDPRFNGRNNNKILFTDDFRTNLDISLLIQWEKNGKSGDPAVNPSGDGSIKEYEDIYDDYFSPYYGTNQALLNSDGGMLIATYVDVKDSSNGMYAYNGDSMLASIGNGQEKSENMMSDAWYNFACTFDIDDLNPENPNYDDSLAPYHVISPEDNLFALDTVVINNKSIKTNDDGTANLDDSKTHSIYNFTYKTLLDHLDYSQQTHVATTDGSADSDPKYIDEDGTQLDWYDDPNQIWATDDDGNYIYDSMNNFDWVLYVSPWAKIDQYIWGYQYDKVSEEDDYSYQAIDCGADYFWETVEELYSEYTDFDQDTEDNLCYPWVEMLLQTYSIEIGNQYHDAPKAINCMEQELSDLNKSNIHWGYVRVKNNL